MRGALAGPGGRPRCSCNLVPVARTEDKTPILRIVVLPQDSAPTLLPADTIQVSIWQAECGLPPMGAVTGWNPLPLPIQ